MASNRTLARQNRHLSIQRFSAIEEADIILTALTILTGPQASGKSLICKLTYYFQDIFEELLRSIQEGQTLSQFQKSEGARFIEWFPASAWGGAPFRIIYKVDAFNIEIKRAGRSGRLKNDVIVRFSESLSTLYDEVLEAYESQRKKSSREDQISYIRSEQNFRFRYDFYKNLSGQIGLSLTSSQTYVPASRAFFTTIGKAMSAFEHGQLLDPITKSFGRLYMLLADRIKHGFPISYSLIRAGSVSGPKYRNNRMAEIFGGRPKIERNDMVIESPDGRLIPLYALSSGQQELLPLWLSLDYFETSISYNDSANGAQFLYIEEPEAHLFPEAQTGVLEILASLLRKPDSKSQMVITTHSPYLLAKTNNLLLAGRLGYRKRQARQKLIEDILPKSRWLLPGEVSCYGLSNGFCNSLIGEDGLISTDYIDSVSHEIVDEFQQLYDVLFQ